MRMGVDSVNAHRNTDTKKMRKTNEVKEKEEHSGLATHTNKHHGVRDVVITKVDHTRANPFTEALLAVVQDSPLHGNVQHTRSTPHGSVH